MFPEVLYVLLGRVPKSTEAALFGFRAARLEERVYPVLVSDPASHTLGRLIGDLAPDEWGLLDAFEAPIYALPRIVLANGQAAWTYALAAQGHHPYGDWDSTAFARDQLSAYVRRCTRWLQRHQTGDHEL